MKIFIFEDSRLARLDLRTLLAAIPDADIVGEAAELAPAREAIETAKVGMSTASLLLRFGEVRLWAHS